MAESRRKADFEFEDEAKDPFAQERFEKQDTKRPWSFTWVLNKHWWVEHVVHLLKRCNNLVCGVWSKHRNDLYFWLGPVVMGQFIYDVVWILNEATRSDNFVHALFDKRWKLFFWWSFRFFLDNHDKSFFLLVCQVHFLIEFEEFWWLVIMRKNF